MRRRIQQSGGQLVGIFATLVYLITMDRTVSWWDCGEFIATGWTLGVGHPPGAPTYQLITHIAMLLSFGNTAWIAPLSNAVSAVCGGITVGLLYATLRGLGIRSLGAYVGALCYLFCDTAWFSSVESEVYAMAMLICSLNIYLAVRYRHTGNSRLIPLIGLVTGLGVGVHLMTLLALPAVALLYLQRQLRWQPIILAIFFFMLGLSTYMIIPLRAESNPEINEIGDGFGHYLRRDQYEKASLYPRMWRERDTANWVEWNAGRTDLLGNVVYAITYQAGYMYFRYLMYNFIGRQNMKTQHIVLFILPLLLGLLGLWRLFKRQPLDAWVVMLLFLFGGLLLNIYLNHPCYEPRERDYAYILSFYAFAIWIGVGADSIPWHRWAWLALLAPLTIAIGNWSDHDRHNIHSVHDIAANHLESCSPDAILITLGDNDTFPLWYMQQVEGIRTDISVLNVGLEGWNNIINMLDENAFKRPVYISHYFYQRYAHLFQGRLRCEGFCHRVFPTTCSDSTPIIHDNIRWNITPTEYIDPISAAFIDTWEQNTGQPVPIR